MFDHRVDGYPWASPQCRMTDLRNYVPATVAGEIPFAATANPITMSVSSSLVYDSANTYIKGPSIGNGTFNSAFPYIRYSGTATDTSGRVEGCSIARTLNPGSASTAVITGIRGAANPSATSNISGATCKGLHGTVQFTGASGTFGTGLGLDASVITASGGNITTAEAVRAFIQCTGGGAITTAYNINSQSPTQNTTAITTWVGVHCSQPIDGTLFTSSPRGIEVVSGSTDVFYTDGLTNVIVGVKSLATSATKGFPYISSMAGAPSGTPTAYTGMVPMVYDTTNNKLMVYNGAWKGVALA